MAFIFNPNPSEGDKQTNPDTDVEYIYSGGAWRALGPKIEDEFDTLDGRYIKLNGRSDVGDAYTIKGPGETTGATSTFHQINDVVRNWGPDWYFSGLLFHLNATSSGVGSDTTSIKIYKAYVSHKGRTNSSNYRLLLPKPRTLANINASNIAFE